MLPVSWLSGLSRLPRGWILAAVALVATAVLFYAYGLGSGMARAERAASERLAAFQKEVDEREAQARASLDAVNRIYRERERGYEQQISDLRAQYAREQAEAAARDERTIADLRAGNSSLRLAVASCRNSTRPGETEPAPGGADGAGDAELAPETSAALWAIAADGDRAIRKLTALQAWAGEAVKLCNATPEAP